MATSANLDTCISECARLRVNALHGGSVQAKNGGWPQAEWATIAQGFIDQIKNFVKLEKRILSL